MGEEILTEGWAWMDDELRLDTDSPLGISRSLWEEFTSGEAVVRSLFPSTPEPHAKDLISPEFFSEKPVGSPKRSCSWEIVPDCSLLPLKRTRRLQFYDEELINSTPDPSESISIDSEFVGGGGECSQGDGPPSSDSLWYITTEESLGSAYDAVEQSAESWMVGCISDSDTSDVQEIPPPFYVNSPISTEASDTTWARSTGVVSKSRRTPRDTPANVSCNVSHPKPFRDTPGQLQINRRAHIMTNQDDQVKEITRPVLAYPFALVKPSGIQGDVTLQDINQRMKMVPGKPRHGTKASYWKSLASPLSGKAVVALTRIQTEGNGTITILRTRS